MNETTPRTRLYIMAPFRHSCDRTVRECECWLPRFVEGEDGEPVRSYVRYRHARGLNRHARRSLARSLMNRAERKLLKAAV